MITNSSSLIDLQSLIKKLESAFLFEARRADGENTFPIHNFTQLKENNLLSLVIPKQFGGLGIQFSEYQHLISQLAKGCASTASAFNMHNIILGALADIPFEQLGGKQAEVIMPFIERIFYQVVHERKVFASATSEPGIGARYSKTKTVYERVAGGYVINGEKSFVTMAEYADYYSIIANKKSSSPEPSPSSLLSFFLVDSKQDGIKIIKDWDTLGMRATQSHRIIFNNVFVPDENVFMGVTGFALLKVIRAPHWVIGGYMGVYLGIMQAALDFCLNYIAEKSDYNEKTGLAFESLIQIRVAEMYTLYQHAANAIHKVSKCISQGNHDQETHRQLYLAKYTVGESAIALTSLAIKTCGGLSIQKKFDLERLFRDSRCGALMPATSDVCQLHIGRSLLNLPTDTLW